MVKKLADLAEGHSYSFHRANALHRVDSIILDGDD